MIDILYKAFIVLMGGLFISIVCVVFYIFWILILITIQNKKKDNEDFIDWFI
jgi:hypothetical protein